MKVIQKNLILFKYIIDYLNKWLLKTFKYKGDNIIDNDKFENISGWKK